MELRGEDGGRCGEQGFPPCTKKVPVSFHMVVIVVVVWSSGTKSVLVLRRKDKKKRRRVDKIYICIGISLSN